MQALRSIANQIAACIPEYRTELLKVDRKELREENVRTLFNAILAEPFRAVRGCGSNLVVVLDALDECDKTQRESLLDIVANKWRLELPDWLGLVVTTRPEHPIAPRLAQYQPEATLFSLFKADVTPS